MLSIFQPLSGKHQDINYKTHTLIYVFMNIFIVWLCYYSRHVVNKSYTQTSLKKIFFSVL